MLIRGGNGRGFEGKRVKAGKGFHAKSSGNEKMGKTGTTKDAGLLQEHFAAETDAEDGEAGREKAIKLFEDKLDKAN